MTDTNEQPGSKPRMWLRILLGLSLALNLLVLGLAGGAMMRFGGPEEMRPPPRSVGGALYRALPHEDRHALRSSHSRRRHDGAKDGHANRHKASIAEVSAAMRASPFDAGALVAILDAQMLMQNKGQQQLRNALIERVSGMTSQQRQAYADRLDLSADQPWFRSRKH